VGEISVAKSGGTKKNSSDVACQRTPRVVAVLSVSLSRKSVVRKYWLWIRAKISLWSIFSKESPRSLEHFVAREQ